jgi:hypothetical protein
VTHYPLDYSGPSAPILRAVGLFSRWAGVDVGPDRVTVRMGWGFWARLPRTSVRSARLDTDRVLAWGVHGWRGKWLVNASSRGVVRIELDPVARARVLGFPVRLRILRVGMADPAGLLAALQPRP